MRRALALALLAPLLVLAACGDDGDDVDAGGSGPLVLHPSDDLDGRTFRATQVTEAGAPRPLVEGTELRLTFSEGRLDVEAGCNHLGGTYRREGDTIRVQGLGGTEMGCDPDRMEQDAWIVEVLGQPIEVDLEGTTLALTAGDTVLVLTDREAEAPVVGLVGPTWVLDTLISGDGSSGTASTPPAGAEASITFARDGSYEVLTGCNRGHGAYLQEDGTIVLSPPNLSRRGCAGPEGELEAAVVTVLAGEATAELDDQRLTLTNGDQALGFRAG